MQRRIGLVIPIDYFYFILIQRFYTSKLPNTREKRPLLAGRLQNDYCPAYTLVREAETVVSAYGVNTDWKAPYYTEFQTAGALISIVCTPQAKWLQPGRSNSLNWSL